MKNDLVRYNIAATHGCRYDRRNLCVCFNLGGKWRNEMKKALVIIGGLALAGCGAGVVPIVTSIYDAVNTYTLAHCGYSFAFATIDAITKALQGQPVADVIGGLLCTQARQLAAQQAPKAAGATATGQSIVDLGTVVINGKLIRIQVLR